MKKISEHKYYGTTWIMDAETYLHFFCSVFYNIETKETITFEISNRKNDIKALRYFLRHLNLILIGFNIDGFDYPVLDYILKSSKDLTCKDIHLKANKIIASNRANIKKPLVKTIDLFTIHNYGNKNKSTSLKWLEFTFKMNKIQDLPYGIKDELTPLQMDELISYCKHDVSATNLLYIKSLKHIELRDYYVKNEGINVISASEPNLAKAIFKNKLAKEMEISEWDLSNMRSPEDTFSIKDVIFDYIKFNDSRNIELFEKLKASVWVDKSEMNDKDKKANTIKFEAEYEHLHRVVAEGGIHSFNKSGVYESDDEYVICDLDFKSYYPHLTFKNAIGPKHIPQGIFNKLYEGFYTERLKYPKKDPRNYVLKIILNSSYGLSKDKYSFLYSPFWQMQICINGQLILMMLTEMLYNKLSYCEAIFENTDGVCIRMKRSDMHLIDGICKEMESICKIPLEYEYCDKFIARDVNNYINVISKDNIKYKGAFEIDKDWHKNHSQRIVNIALKRYFIDGIDVRDTISNHMSNEDYEDIKNHGIFDFCIGAKKSSSHYWITTKDEPIKLTDKVIRYYIGNGSSKIFKESTGGKSKGRLSAMNKGFNSSLFMDYEEKEDYQINYLYYVNECNKIIKEIEKPKFYIEQLKLF